MSFWEAKTAIATTPAPQLWLELDLHLERVQEVVA
jgi:hypothetical protein